MRGEAEQASPRISGSLWHPTGSEELEQVGGCAYQLPLCSHVLQTAQAEAAEASLLLDLAEDRLDDDLAHLVYGSPGLGAELVLHGLLGCS